MWRSFPSRRAIAGLRSAWRNQRGSEPAVAGRVRAAPFTAGAAVAGLMIDDWVEVLPSQQQITGLSLSP